MNKTKADAYLELLFNLGMNRKSILISYEDGIISQKKFNELMERNSQMKKEIIDVIYKINE